jgi:hypothetical protein
MLRAGIAIGSTTEGLVFESQRVENFLYLVPTGSGAHPASYPMATGGSFLGGGG